MTGINKKRKSLMKPLNYIGMMRVTLTGLLLAIATTIMLQVAMFFQDWGRYNQTTDFMKALSESLKFMLAPRAWYSVFVCFAFFVLIYAILNRFFITIAIYLITAIVVFVAEYMKVKARNEPIMFSDMSEATAVGGLTGMVDRSLLTGAIGLGLIVVILALILEYLTHKQKLGRLNYFFSQLKFKNNLFRLIMIIITFSSLSVSFVVNADHNQAWLQKFGYQRVVYSSGDDSLWNGPIATFMSNVSTVIMREPANYSSKEMRRIEKEYDNSAKNINETRHGSTSGQTIAYILSESLANPNDIKGFHYKGANVSQHLEEVKQRATVSGKMLSSGYGGGTANIEYMTLAGFPLATYAPEMTVPYVQLVPFANTVPNISQLFDKKEVLHPFVGSLYNRKEAYKKMGINHFYTTDNKEDTYPKKYRGGASKDAYPKDDNAFSYLEDKILKQNNKKSQFVQLMTMQNHMPYYQGEYPNNHYQMTKPVVSGSTKTQIESYLAGVHESDLALEKLIKHVDNSKRPITLVFYGDHWPGIFTFVDPQNQAEEAHETDYFIYQNDAAKKRRQAQSNISRPYASPSDFPALALDAMNVKISPFYALQTQVSEQLPAFANYTRGKFVDEQGNTIKTKQLTSKQKRLLADFKLVQYDLSDGKHYLSQKFTKPVK
ncbi:LTA synthase family protein [Weissella bombi]|uniref:Phosphoglycerol transferase MdoB n=1 Tax=Weissella bombi TaxID=1505725 RepID=A0A1C3Z6F1_9LACO|nr:LTA synthase family protein [Weissella bombi]SCB77929.1 Phosphoglycerol transferase MdoB [Weissella bombi]